MEPLYDLATYTGAVYPNDTVINWSVMIVIYPYITGLVAGAFTVSSLYHVFGMERFKPVAQFALLTALCFMLFVPVPLLLHLGQPQRAFNAVLTPHWTSAMAAFGYFAGFYMILLTLEVWFMFRPHFVQQAQQTTGLAQTLWRGLSLGSYDLSDKAMRYDHKWMFALAVAGIPGAHGFHGYIGYKAREGIETIMEYVMGPLVVPFFVIQFGIGAVTPIAVISYLIWRATTGRALIVGVTVSAALVLLSVLMMRWNVVIGGQEISKTGQGLLNYQMQIWGREGMVAAASTIIAPLILLAVMVRLLPP